MLAVALILMVLMFAGLAPDVMKHDGRNWKKTYVPHTSAPAEHGGAAGHGGSGH
jgi:hypothetical protein